MRSHTAFRIAMLLVLAALGGARAAERAAPRPVAADGDMQQRLGVQTEALAAAAAPAAVTSTARVLDPGPLIQLDSELTAAAAATTASRAEAARTRKLYDADRTASSRALETAQAQAQADAQRSGAAQRRLLLEWGAGVAGLSGARRSALLSDLANVRAELVRVELPAGLAVPAVGTAIRMQSGADGTALEGRALGMLPGADPRLQTRGLLVELRGPQATLAVGQMLAAQLPAPPAAPGVLVPRSALLRKDSKVWVYAETSSGTFVRREVKDYRPLAAGWFVPAGFVPGQRVVTVGAAALLGIEAPPQVGGD